MVNFHQPSSNPSLRPFSERKTLYDCNCLTPSLTRIGNNNRELRGYSLFQVGKMGYSAVSQARKRLQLRLKREPKLKKRFDKLSEQLLQLSRGKI